MAAEDEPRKATPGPAPYLAVVRQGHDDIFQFLQHFRDSNLTELLWDRRISERRALPGPALPDRRVPWERRDLPSPTWGTLGFVLSPVAGARTAPVLEPGTADPVGPTAAEGSHDLCVVRLGHTDVFHTMVDHFREDPRVQVIWDRRMAERRVRPVDFSPDRRLGDRRRLL